MDYEVFCLDPKKHVVRHKEVPRTIDPTKMFDIKLRKQPLNAARLFGIKLKLDQKDNIPNREQRQHETDMDNWRKAHRSAGDTLK